MMYLIHIFDPTRLLILSFVFFCLNLPHIHILLVFSLFSLPLLLPFHYLFSTLFSSFFFTSLSYSL
ncbi:hypothetical protein AMQ83_33090, partial [Paenibacillus riograndensis]